MKKLFYSFYQNLITYRLLVAIAIVLLAISGAFYVLITAPNNFVFTEELQYWAYGNATVKYAFLHFGQLGLWDIYNGLGYPLIGHMSSQFYPFTLLGFLIPNDLFSIRLQVFVHLLLAGISFFYLLSVLKIRIPAKVLGSICFVVNDYVYFVVYRGFLTETYNLVWMTLAVAFLWQALFKKKPIYAILCGIALAMHVIAMISYTIYFTGIILLFLFVFYFLYQQAFKKENFVKTFLFLIKTATIIGITFLGISAIKLLPVLQYSFYSTRTSYPLYNTAAPGSWELATIDSVIKYITNFLIPQGQVPLKYGFAVILTFLANTLFFILFLYSLLKKSRAALFFWIVTIIILWASMGKHAFFDMYALFYYFVPGIKTVYYSQRMFIVTNLTIPLLAAFGFDVAWQNIKRFRFINYVILVLILVPIVLYVRAQMLHYITITSDHRTFHPDNVFTQQLTNLVKQQNQVIHVASSYYQDSKSVGNYSAIYNRFLLANPPLESFQLSYQQMPLFGMTVPYFGINDTNINDFLRKKYTYLRLMNVFYYVTTNLYDDKATNYTTPIFTEQKNNREDGTIYKINNPNPFIISTPHAFLFIGKDTLHDFNALKVKSLVLSNNFGIEKHVIFSTDKDISKLDISAFAGFIIDDIIPVPNNIKDKNYVSLHFSYHHYDYVSQRSNSVFVDNPAVYLTENEQEKFDTFLQKIDFNADILSQQKNNPTIKLLTFTPEKLIFSVTTSKPIAITIADIYFPNWNAKLDNKALPIFMSDGLLKGILIPQGTHTITLKYVPIFFYVGAAITSISLVLLGIYVYRIVKKKK